MSSPDLNVSQVDWRQLRRWGISEARVPAGTLVRFRELSAWERYKALHSRRGGAPAGADGADRRAARSAVETPATPRSGCAEVRRSCARATSDIRDLGARLLNAQDTERSRIARELHDDISQQMALLEIDLELLSGAVQERGRAGLAGEALNRAHGIARSVHDLSHRLHPAKLRLIGLVRRSARSSTRAVAAPTSPSPSRTTTFRRRSRPT